MDNLKSIFKLVDDVLALDDDGRAAFDQFLAYRLKQEAEAAEEKPRKRRKRRKKAEQEEAPKSEQPQEKAAEKTPEKAPKTPRAPKAKKAAEVKESEQPAPKELPADDTDDILQKALEGEL